ncbi:dimethylsulfonioproprionate lyase family protein [Pseudogemmobacter humi]|uniref:Uncharacterized protein n=1 Tax=Pseudogemmobacter humi TaxID=2483812 RepID=A0A3P5X091_9RHOB|nr:dimethylsulfonioproprionate lyase family protein [Pseudogemmobacter humi]VDC21279.1 hypothetical protein XINFAN_00617 [Pseudogemmobacter humi]
MSGARLWHQLTRPAGPPGSARARYGAAMELHAQGRLSRQQLEAYREASAFDDQDPAQVLTDRGLAVPEAPPPSPALALTLLADEIDRCLATLASPGIAETRSGFAALTRQAPQPRPGPEHPVAAALLPPALAALAGENPTLAEAIALAAPHLTWESYGYGPGIGPHFPQSHAFASLAGESAPFTARDFDLGLFLIAPHTLYRDHAHAAPELYLPLTGPHRWRFTPGAGFREKPALAPVWNPPHRPHATLTGAQPFLALYAWTRDTRAQAYVLPADDWPTHEPTP